MTSSKLPIILQNERTECGHACVAMVANYWGHQYDLYGIRKIMPTSNRGISLLEIKNILDSLGFATRALRVSLKDLKQCRLPAILHWDMNHFVVLKKVHRHYLTIHDPALGIRHCGWDEVSSSFTGILLEIEKSESFVKQHDNQPLRLIELFKTAKGLPTYLYFLVILSVAIEVFVLFNPLLMQYVTDNIIVSSALNNLYTLACAFVLLVGIQTFTEFIRGNMVIYLTNNLNEQFSAQVVQHILKLPISFFEKRQKGDIHSKFLSIDQIQKKISTDFINTLLDGLLICLNFAVMFIYSKLLSIIVSLSLILNASIRYVSYQHLKNHTATSIQQHALSTSLFLEILQGILPIKTFAKENNRFNIWRNANIKSLNADIKIAKMNVIYNTINQLMGGMESVIIICMGAKLVLANQFSLGMLMAFMSYRLLLVNKAWSFIQNIFSYKLISIQLQRLNDILLEPSEIIASGCGDKAIIVGRLTLENVSFGYHAKENLLLKNINLDIQAGEKVVITGSSGCGKTTLLKMMMGLLECTTGKILIDQNDIKVFGLKNYRDCIASVMQEDSLLSGSIADNIAFFDQTIDMEDVYSAARIASIHEAIIQLPMKYETLVGDMGTCLSGGQKQRILLARALYKKPKILFLDEATSHLDTLNESNINQALKKLDITQIIIAHREETIRAADRIINLESINDALKFII